MIKIQKSDNIIKNNKFVSFSQKLEDRSSKIMDISGKLFLLCSSLIVGCANNPIRSYKSETDKTLTYVRQGEMQKADNSLDNKDDVLYHLEYGTLLRMGESYPASRDNFVQAQAWVNAWMASYHNGTLGSVVDTSQAVLVNDKVLDYQIKDYEKVMIPTYQALNNISLNNWDNARVEVQRMYQLETIIKNYRDALYAKEQADSSKNTNSQFASLSQVEQSNSSAYDFTSINSPQVVALQNGYQNAFSHYLAGFAFQALGENSLSRPGYINALKLNPNNQMIQQSITNLDKGGAQKPKTTDLLLVSELGNAPQFKSVTIHVPLLNTNANNKNTCVTNVTIAFPALVPDKLDTNLNVVQIDGNSIVPTLFTDFNLMAARYVHDDLPNIFIRNIARAARDVVTQQVACNNGGSLLNLATVLTEAVLNQADERTWVMLPSKIYATRISLPMGKHVLTVYTPLGPQTLTVNLNQPYQVITYRQIGNQVYFSPQQ